MEYISFEEMRGINGGEEYWNDAAYDTGVAIGKDLRKAFKYLFPCWDFR